MTAQHLADNALVQVASARMQAATEVLRRIPLAVWQKTIIVLALFWITHSLAKLFWVLYPVPDLPQPTTIAQPLVDEAVSAEGGIDLQLLQALNLGGTEAPAPEMVDAANAPPPSDQVEETKLSLKLQGILESSDETRGKAIIADGNTQALYQVGETLPQGRNVKLAQVLHDKVIIDNNGNFESLLLYTDADFQGMGSVVSSSVSNVPIPQRRAVGVDKAPEHVQPGQVNEGGDAATGTISREQLRAKSINEVVRFSLHQENGQVLGYRIRPGRDRETFEKLGLQNNDIVTSVNGIAVTDRNQLREMYKTMRTATEAQLEVNRDGAIIPISIRLETE